MLCQRDGRRNTGTQRTEWVWDAGAGASSPSALRTSRGTSCCFQPAWVPQAQHDPASSSSTWPSHTGLTPRCGSTWMQSPSDAAWSRDLRPGVPGAEELPVLCCWEPGGEAAPFLPRGCSVWRKLRRAPGPHLTGVHVARIHLQTPSKMGLFPPTKLSLPQANGSTQFFPPLGSQRHGQRSFCLPGQDTYARRRLGPGHRMPQRQPPCRREVGLRPPPQYGAGAAPHFPCGPSLWVTGWNLLAVSLLICKA